MNVDIYNTDNKYGIIYTDPPGNSLKVDLKNLDQTRQE